MRFVSSDSAALFDGMTDWTIGVFYKSTEEKLLRQYTYLDSDFASEYTPTTLLSMLRLKVVWTKI